MYIHRTYPVLTHLCTFSVRTVSYRQAVASGEAQAHVSARGHANARGTTPVSTCSVVRSTASCLYFLIYQYASLTFLLFLFFSLSYFFSQSYSFPLLPFLLSLAISLFSLFFSSSLSPYSSSLHLLFLLLSLPLLVLSPPPPPLTGFRWPLSSPHSSIPEQSRAYRFIERETQKPKLQHKRHCFPPLWSY